VSRISKASKKYKHNKRPIIDIPYSQLEIIMEAISAVGVLALIILIIITWPELPDRIPSHFGSTGMPDGWGSKTSIWVLTGVGVGFYALLTIVSRFPHTFNYLWAITEENAERQYQIARTMVVCLKAEMIWLFVYMEFGIIQVAMDKIDGLGVVFVPITLIVIFGTIFLCLIKGYLAR
jgi:uncharacterized membrane protein